MSKHVNFRSKFFTVSTILFLSLFQNIYVNAVGTEVSSSTTISSSGLYVLGQDISGYVNIDSDNVCLDLNCYRVYDTTTTTTPIKILSGHANVTIKNGSVVGSGTDSTIPGIVVEQGATCIKITDVKVLDCDIGISLDGASGSEIEGCSVDNCKVDSCNKGYLADYAIKSVFENCQALNCVQSGFEQTNSQFNVFEKCKALKTGDGSTSSDDVAGFLSSAGTGNLYRECVAEGTVKTASVVGADTYGLAFLSTETESKVCNCVFNSTSLIGSGTAYGIYAGDSVFSCLIQENKICNTTGNATGVYGSSSNNVFIKNLGYENDTNFSSGITNVFTDGLGVNPNLLDNISLPGEVVFSCPSSITSAGVYKLEGVGTCCITIDSDDVTLDLQGYTLYCPTSNSIEILHGHKNITIKNGSINGSSLYDGIFTNTGCEFVKIEDIHMRGCDNAISFNGALGVEIKSCKVIDCKFDLCTKGVFAYYLIKSVFENCQALNCKLSGFEQQNSQFNIFDKCKALQTGENSAQADDVAGFLSSAGTGNLYTECVTEGINKSASDVGADAYGLAFLSTETESKVCNSVFNSTSLIGSGTAYGIYTGDSVYSCLIQTNKICNTTGNATGVYGSSSNNVFIKNLGYENDANFSPGITNVFTDGLSENPNLLDNISLPATATATAGTCPSSITVAGVYKVSDPVNCCITIDADDVTLDLQGYALTCATAHSIEILHGHKNITIKNGSINGSSLYDGIFANTGCEFIKIENVYIRGCDNAISFNGALGVEIKSCKVIDCKFDLCTKGVFADYMIKSVFENCQALNCAQSGFEQLNSQFNIFDKCKALQTGENSAQSDTVAGFLSFEGRGNLYTECIAEGTNKDASDAGANVYGLAFLSTETESKICNCVFNSTSLIGSGTAYGIYLETFDEPSFSRLVDSYDHGANVFSVDWSSSDSYLAIGGSEGTGGAEVRVLGFDGSTLSDITTATFDHGNIVLSVDWSPNGGDLAVGGYEGTGGAEVRVLGFDGSYLSEIDNYDHGDTVFSVDWSSNVSYLAIGGSEGTGGAEVRVLGFDGSALSDITTATFDHGGGIRSVDWSSNGSYLAIGGLEGTGGAEVRVLGFDGSTLSGITTATFDHGEIVSSVEWSPNGNYLAIGGSGGTGGYEVRVLSFDGLSLSEIGVNYYHGDDVSSVAWTPDGNYLSIGGGNGTGGYEVRLLSFNGSSLSEVTNYDHGGGILSVGWTSSGNYLAIGGNEGTGGYEVRVFGPFYSVTNCLIESNKVCNTTGNATGVYGDSDNNVFIKNIGYQNGTNFSSGITNVFTDGLDENPNLLDNISLPATASAGTCPSSITAEGVYEVSDPVNCCITIDADDVTLDLQGYALNCTTTHAIEILHGHKNITIKNGSINGSSLYDGIFTNTGCEFIKIENVYIRGCDNAISFNGALGVEIKSCKVIDCKFDLCTKGVFADYLIKSVFENCQALNCVQSGFEQLNSQFNIFDKCKALQIGENSAQADDVAGFLSSAGTGNLYTECVTEGTNKSASDVGADVYGLAFLSTETESKVCNCVFNSTSLLGSGAAYGIYTGDSVSSCLIQENKICNTTGSATGVYGDSDNNVFIKNIGYQNDTNFSSEITNVFTDGLDENPNLLDNISLPETTAAGTCPSSITAAGVYKVSDPVNCCITIDADDVTLDLQGYALNCTTTHAIEILHGHKNITIKNGSINGSSLYDGIFANTGCEFIKIENVYMRGCDNAISFNGALGVEIKSCKVVDCKFDLCTKGVFADYLIKSVFENCQALNCAQSGFEQLNSQFNIFDKCKALQTGENSAQADDVAGFLSSAGTGNLYTECVAEGTNKASSEVGADVYGLAFLSTETESKVCNCVFNSTSLIGSGTAYGIYLETLYELFFSRLADSYDHGDYVLSVDWSPNGSYLSIGGAEGNGGAEVRVLSFDGATLSGITTATFDHGAQVFSVDWSPSGIYLAIGGQNSPLDGAEVRALSFDGVTLSGITTATFDHGALVSSVDWSPSGSYLAIGGQNSPSDGAEVRVLGFDGSTLSGITNATYDHGANINSVEWSPNGNYLAVGGAEGTGGAEVRVLGFDGSTLSDITTATFDHGGGDVESVAWSPDGSYLAIGGDPGTGGSEVVVLRFDGSSLSLVANYVSGELVNSVEWSPDGNYLAIGVDVVAGAEARVLSFNGSSLSEIANYDHGNTIFSVGWASSGNYLAIGGEEGTGGYEVRVFGPFADVTNCLIESNKVCNTMGNATGVYGDSDNNVFMKNIGYQNDTNFSSGVTNVFTDGLAYDPKLLDNISLPGTTTSASCPGTTGTISASGVYTVNGTDSCCITINADDVYLDLQGYTLVCTTGNAISVVAGKKNITIKNGAIEGNGTYDGIFVDTGCEFVRIEDISIYSCDNGITFSGALGSEIKSCNVKNCEIHDCNKGLLATYIKKTVFEKCSAKNCVEAGFEQLYSEFNVYKKCKALEISNPNATGGAVGFSSLGGTGNLYTKCIAEGTSVSDSSEFCNCAVGFLLTGTEDGMETESKIINCVSNSTQAGSDAVATAYGIQLDPEYTGESALTEFADYEYNEDINSVKWSPNTNYLAIGGNVVSGAEVRVLGFDGVSLSDITSATVASGTDVNSVSWSPNGDYLVFGADTGSGDEVSVLSFDGALLGVEDTASHGANVNSVDWSPDGKYIAVGGASGTGGPEVRVLSFDGVSLSALTTATYEQAATVNSVDWSPDGNYIAIGGESLGVAGGTEVKVFSFDGASLSLIAGADTGSVATRALAWSPNGKYLVVGAANNVVVYSFDGSSLTYTGAFYVSNAFYFSWSPNGKFIAIGASITEVVIVSFDGSSLTLVSSYNQGTRVNSVDWSSGGNYLAVGTLKSDVFDEEVKVFDVMDAPSTCLIEGNKVCNTTGWGIGISGGENNFFIKNLGYGNDVNFSYGVVPKYLGGLTGSAKLNDNISLLP